MMTHRTRWIWAAIGGGLWACGSAVPDEEQPDSGTATAPTEGVPEGVWQRGLPALDQPRFGVRGKSYRRAVIHLHSPYSHDACDGDGWSDKGLDEACHADLYEALCALNIDYAGLTDHPDHGDTVPLADRFYAGTTPVTLNGGWWGGAYDCGGHTLRLQAGFEDEVMPVGLRREVSNEPTLRHELLNRSDAEAMAAMQTAGGRVMVAHPEGRTRETMLRLQDEGLHGTEVFNVHAAFAPDIREEDLGLDPLAWLTDIAPFLDEDNGLEPDLLFYAVLAAQAPSLAHFDALTARGPVMPTLGTDAHQNVLTLALSDGERVDSYRRSIRFGTTWLLADDASVEGLDAALAAKRSHVVFEILGTPEGLDVSLLSDDGTRTEVGDEGAPGMLEVGCPTLSPWSPRGAVAPEIDVRVLKDGAPFAQGCGTHPVGPGVYRVEVWQRPEHLRPFLGGQADALIRDTPWIYSGAVAVRQP